MTVFELIEANGLNLHGDIEHFAALIEAAARADEREQIAAWYEAEGQMTFPVAIPKIIRARGTT